MALAGNIKEFELADIFQIVSLQQKTGILTIERSEGKVTILLEHGLIVGADATFRPIEERIEQSLVQSHQISKFQLKRATETQKKTHQPFWTVLAEMGEIDLGTLQKVLSQQIHETVYHVLRWTEGEYRFDPHKSIEYDRQLISPVNTEFLVMEGFRITDEWSELEKEISSLQLVIRRTSGISTPPAELSEAEKKVYNLLATERTIQEVIDMGLLGEFDTCQTVYELMRKNLVEKVPGKKERMPKFGRRGVSFKDVFLKAATFGAGIAVLVGVIFLFKYLPKHLTVIHIPSFQAIGQVKQFTAQSQLNNLSQVISLYFLEHHELPASFNDLLQEKFISSPEGTDPWGHQYLMNTAKNVVIIRSVGKDGAPQTNDDISLEIPF